MTKTTKTTTKKTAKPAAKKTIDAATKKAAAEAIAEIAAKVAKTAKPAAKKTAAKKEAKPATGKGATILSLIARKGGATATELQTATGWQAHSVRGFLSTAAKKGAKFTSAKREDGQRVYSA